MRGNLRPPAGHLNPVEFRDELLGRLGLTPDASDQEIETAHGELVEFLDLAPHSMRSWAADRAAEADEAFAILSGPALDLAAMATLTAVAVQNEPSLNPSSATEKSLATSKPPSKFAAIKARRTLLLWLGVPVLAAAIVLGVYSLGGGSTVPGISGTPTNQASAGASPAVVDPVKVSTLMQRISSNPKDLASLQGLGDLYFGAGDYRVASVWEQKILAIDPTNQVALLALGAAQFNLGNQTEAKKQWLLAAKLYPNLAEAHYDLGFLYFSQSPPDLAKVRVEWNKVIAIDPNSSVAKTVATHLKSLQKPSPSASVSPSQK